MNPDPLVLPMPGCDRIAPPPGRAELSRARRATRVQFAVLGITGGVWGAHIPSLKARYALDELTLSLVLLAAAGGAVLALFFAGRIVGWLGARRAAVLAAFAMGSMLALALALPHPALLLPTMLLFGGGLSLFDVAINAEGTTLEVLGGRAVMSNLHAMFSVGGMLGAALAAALLRGAVPPLAQMAAVGVGAAALAGIAARGMLDTHPESDAEQAPFAWPRGTLLVIGLLIFAGMTAEGVMYDWCVLYLKQELAMPQSQAALGYAAFSAAMAAARFGADALRNRYPEGALLGCSAGLAALAMAAVLLSAEPWFALIGFALVGAGLAPVVPILYTAATRVGGVSRAAAIASVSSIGYAGFMIGPPLIGGIAHVWSLTHAMSVVVIAAALLAVGARRVANRRGS